MSGKMTWDQANAIEAWQTVERIQARLDAAEAERDKIARNWHKQVDRANAAEAALREIIACDYRGNKPVEQQIAQDYFDGLARSGDA